ncbi:MAG: RNA polymerase associated protein RapA [Rhodanobacteraceae bacterium]|jgi:ATP-dependent helicase HepA|nr:MAG: RNA polymerase associated protein RapA [Rhodanobacteraceae bacterium]
MDYIPGQRWVSEAEPELGLGTVLRCDDRAIQVLFAKSGVVRNYSSHGAPLARATFRVGQRIAGRGITFVVERIDLRDGLLVYSGEKRELAEGQLDDEQSLSQADARLISARVDKPHQYELRKRALLARAAARRSDAWGILSARVDLLPHQLGVVAACMEREHPRVLLADEAGLGKTIEAGMLVARMLATGRAARVLILLPDTLLVQWFVELRRRFQLAFAIVDEERCTAIAAADAGRNPFEDEQLAIASLAWLAHAPERKAQALAAGWDMLVVDEAHHLEWTPEAASAEYLAVEALAAATPSVVLLTATPEQLGRRAHFARLRLLDPARFDDLDRYLAEADDYAKLSPLATRIAAAEPLSAVERAALHERYPHDPALLALVDAYPASADALLSALVDRHGAGRIMFRNRRDAVGGFAGRQLDVETGPDALEPLARQDLLAEFDADMHAGDSVRRVIDYSRDPRIEWLLRLLDAHRDDKFLLIAATRGKVEAIEAALRTRSGAAVACFHEDMTLLQRDRAAAWFAQAEGARILLCSEIGSEGRNFQFAHRLVMWDLPLDPDLVEQRIGRLDRIGQRRVVTVHVPSLPGTAQEALARWHADGTRVLRECPADGRELLRRFGDDIVRIARTHAESDDPADPELDDVIAATADAHAELSQAVREGRDRLLELAARHAGGKALLEAMRAADRDDAAHALVQECFEPFGVHVEDLGDGSLLLDPEFLSTDALPGFNDGARRATLDRALALAREELELLRMDHPLVLGAFDLLLAGEFGNASFLVDPALPARSVLLEAVYVVECVADASLDVARFLPPTPIEVRVDSRLASREYVPSPPALARARERALDVSRYRRHLAQLVPPMLEKADALAAERTRSITGTALADARAALDARVQRLRALAELRASVSDEEIARAEAVRAQVIAALAAARPRLDAVRMVVSPDFLALR